MHFPFARMLYKLLQFSVRPIAVFDSRVYMKAYLAVLRASGMNLTGTPRYIAPSAYFDDLKRITLGSRVVISRDVKFLTHDYSITTAEIAVGTAPQTDTRKNGTIALADNVFVGLGAILLPNTEVGENSVIGAGTVVRGRIPSGLVLIGNPARTLMTIEEYARISRANYSHTALEVDRK